MTTTTPALEMNFCRRCGTPLSRTAKHAYICTNGHTIYMSATPGAGIFFVTADNHVLLAVRKNEPYKGMLDVFGGFVDGEESFEEAAVRELREELSLEPDDYEPLQYLMSARGKYPYAGETNSYLAPLFWTRLTTERNIIPLDDVARIYSMPLHNADLAQIYTEDLREGVRRLQALFPHQLEEEK